MANLVLSFPALSSYRTLIFRRSAVLIPISGNKEVAIAVESVIPKSSTLGPSPSWVGFHCVTNALKPSIVTFGISNAIFFVKSNFLILVSKCFK
ncbi:hypothetical protein D3C86_1713070 [compost metagenome]